MPYDQSWMGYGLTGAWEAGGIAAVVGLVMFGVLSRIGRSQDWNVGLEIGWAYFLSVLLAGGQDLWNMFYFNYGRLESIQLLKVRLAEVHDFEGLGQRVFFEFIGAGVGVYVGWLLFGPRRLEK